MSQVTNSPRTSGRQQLRVQLNRLRVARSSGMFGVAEIVALAGSLLVLLIVVVSYFYLLLPARVKLQAAIQEREHLQAVLTNSRTTFQQGLTTEATVRNITESLDNFETSRLFARTQGRMDLYDELNQLIHKNGLRNTSGPNYLPLQAATLRSDGTAVRSTNAKWQSIYPGIEINVTVEGQYQSLRRFIRDIEASKLFIIVNGLEFERATEANATASVEGSPANPKNSLVSLRLDMATYFQRQDSPSPEIEATPNRR